MGWKQRTDPDDIGYMKNDSGSYVLEWQERAPGRKLIASGTFSKNYPFIATARHADQPTVVRCPESKKAVRLVDFEEKQMCLNCSRRMGNEPLYPIVQVSKYPTYTDLAGIANNDNYYSSTDMLVPQGCPCASTGASIYPHRKIAKTYRLGRESELIPKAWKLTFDGSRFRLSFHFRRIFISKNGKFANDGFFQHVVVDIDTGKTFITDVSDGSRRGGEHHSRLVDDITYTGSTVYLSSKLSPDELKTPLEALYNSVVSELCKRGLMDLYDDEMETDLDLDSIADIAHMNRFPGVSDNPFPDRWMLPDRMQRKVTSAPREASVEKLMKHIGLDPNDAELKIAIADYPLSLENIYILKELGCEDRSAWLETCIGSHPADIRYFLRKFISTCTEYGFDGIDVLELMLPKTGAHRNWKRCIDDMATIGSEAGRRSSGWIRSFAENATNAALRLHFPDSDGLRDMIAKVNEADIIQNANIGLYKDQELKDKFQSSKTKWNVSIVMKADVHKREVGGYLSYRSRLAYSKVESGSNTIVSFVPNIEPSAFVDVELHRKATLDRRKWRGALKKGYRNGTIANSEIPEDTITATYECREVLTTSYDISKYLLVSAEMYEKAIRKWGKKHFITFPKNFFSSLM